VQQKQPESVARGIADWRRLAGSLKPELRLKLAACILPP
jgi:hypothetical protein